MTKQADLTAYLFEGEIQQRSGTTPLSSELFHWMESSSRFTTFIETYRDKIRKKIRVSRDPESLLDLRSELEVAYGLLNDRRLVVAYEPYASAKHRGPDFSVTFRANLVCNIEVARMRMEESPPVEIDLARQAERKAERILLYKLGQMLPGMANLLVIHTHEELARSLDLGRLMQQVKIQVEGKDPSFYAAGRYASPASFYKDFLRLSGILVMPSAPSALAPALLLNQVWINKQARPALPEKVMHVISFALQTRSQPSGASPPD